jgi:hypothetical protein
MIPRFDDLQTTTYYRQVAFFFSSLRQGSPYLDYEQLVLNSNKEGMDFLRKGQYKQGRSERPMLDGIGMVSNAGFCLKRMVNDSLMMVNKYQ